jgi:glucose/arabinose dehydrogenase
MYSRKNIKVVLLFWGVIFSAAPLFAYAVPPQFSNSLVASGLSSITAMELAPDGRLFVAEQGGKLRIIKNGTLQTTPFVSLSVDSSGERGLLGMAFDPNFAVNNYIYVYYTTPQGGTHNRISRFTANGDVALSGSETIILELEALNATNHNGGAIHFGIDGKLYVATGDNAYNANAQSVNNRLGKILRINSDGSIPSDNPTTFTTVNNGSPSVVTTTGGNRAIWALGLRNPFSFAVQPGSGKIFINDVGQDSWEEINQGQPGSNYGWPGSEGYTSNSNFRSARFAYPHGSSVCAITGGAFYNPATVTFPSDEYVGDYFFADYCAGWIRRFDSITNQVIDFHADSNSKIDLKVGSDGALYYATRNAIYKVQYTGSVGTPPSITQHPLSQSVQSGSNVSFSVMANGSAPLSYQWQKNGVNISQATSPNYPFVAQSSDNGASYRVIVSNAGGSVTSNAAVLSLISSTAPVANIQQPSASFLYEGGQIVTYSGSGTDAEDGNLPASAFTWKVDFHHDTHVHPFIPETSGSTSGTFVIPRTGETSSDVWYRIYLTVKDSNNLLHTVSRDIQPKKVQLSVTSDPSGLEVFIDGQPVTVPHTFTSVVGVTRTIGVSSPQTLQGVTHTFAFWSGGGAQSHSFNTPSVNSSYMGVFQVTSPSPSSSPVPICTLYSSSSPIPTGFGSPFNVVNNSNQNMMNASCSTNGTQPVTLGNGSQLTYIYKTGYVLRNKEWQQVNYTGTNLLYSNWYAGNATGSLNLTTAELTQGTYFLSYQCQWTQGSPSSTSGQTGVWKCGCRTAACTGTNGNKWQVQFIKQ